MNKSDLKSKLEKSIEFFKTELSNIRTGKANSSLLSDIKADAYGAKMTLKELGSIVSLDNQTLAITPWDKGLLSTIAKAITESDLNLNPVTDSDRVRIPVPPLTEDRRKDLVKTVLAKMEDVKQSIRSIRQDVMKEIEKDFTEKLIGEDEKFTQKDEVEKIIKEYVAKLDELAEIKKQELLKV
jgi:ribosome recycling factor